MSFNVAVEKGINTPNGVYKPAGDILLTECVAAAKYAGMKKFNIKIDGHVYTSAEELPVEKLSALIQAVSVVAVEAKDTAGC